MPKVEKRGKNHEKVCIFGDRRRQGQTVEMWKGEEKGAWTRVCCLLPADFAVKWGERKRKGGSAMAQLLTPGSIVAMTDQAADRLIKLDSGDAALLYLHLLRRGGLEGLRWPEERKQAALKQLQAQGLAAASLSAAPAQSAEPPEAPPPEYALEDITAALSDKASAFPALADEVERRLGKKLTANDLKILYTLYDHLALPAEVIFLLVNWCIEEMERKYGPGRRPFLSQIRREGFIWARKGIDTVEAAERHLQTLARLRTRGAEVLRLLDIQPRPLVEREKHYIETWDAMGFDNEALRAAYERTILKKQSLDWSYMNGILRRWHEKGLHTLAEIQAGDHDPRPVQAVPAQPSTAASREDQRARENMEHIRRLMEQMKQEE